MSGLLPLPLVTHHSSLITHHWFGGTMPRVRRERRRGMNPFDEEPFQPFGDEEAWDEGGRGPRGPRPPRPPRPPRAPRPPRVVIGMAGKDFDLGDLGGWAATGGAEGEPEEELPGEETAGGARRFAVGGARPPRLSISNISGAIQVRGDEAAGDQITVRAINEHGQEVPLGAVAELTYAPDGPGGEPTLKVQPRANIHRQIRRVRDAVNFSKVSFLENIGELVEAVTTIGREWSTVNCEAIVPRRC